MANAFAAYANAKSVTTPKKSYPANIVDVTISRAIVSTVSFAAVQTMAFVNVARAVASLDGPVTIARVKYHNTHACHQMAVKFVQAMANAFAANVNVKKRQKDAIRADTVRNVQHVQDDAKNLKNVFNVKCTKPGQWAIIQSYAQPTAHCLCQKASKN